VKITIIATGFARESQPQSERPAAKIEVAAASQPPVFAVTSARTEQVDEVEPEPVEVASVEPPVPEPVHEESAPMAMAAAAMSPNAPETDNLFDDLEVPAILRSRKRMVQ
jgi:hypothetical protein